MITSARAAFGAPANTPVVQLAAIDFGGDATFFGLIEARQPTTTPKEQLPVGGGVLVSDCIRWSTDERFALNTFYRRNAQLLNPDNVLRAKNDSFDLALAPELPIAGLTVSIKDTTVIEGDTTAYWIQVVREKAEFVDLYFTTPDEFYFKSPDLWVDWPGDNDENVPPGPDVYPAGQPMDQGDIIRFRESGEEINQLVGRIRNRGTIDALEVKVNFYYFLPAGAGDNHKPMDITKVSQYKLIGSAGENPKITIKGGESAGKLVTTDWRVPAGFKGHTCLFVDIEHLKVPRDSHRAALGSSDRWRGNDHAQKNVSHYEQTANSPYAPLEFDFGVFNSGLVPEIAYLEPDALPYGASLTITPYEQTVPQGERAIFRCRLELDDAIIDAGCRNDLTFRIFAWRQDPESAVRWGGVEYQVLPRIGTSTTLTGYWEEGGDITLTGQVSPDPGVGKVRLRLDFGVKQPKWVTAPLTSTGRFTWHGHAPTPRGRLATVARFDANSRYGTSTSAELILTPPPILH
jgi:hypothetical protein